MNHKLLFCITLIFIFGCKSADKKMRPGIFLTFDDRNMLHWEKQIPLFEKYNAHVTFFIDHFDELTTAQLFEHYQQKSMHRPTRLMRSTLALMHRPPILMQTVLLTIHRPLK